MPCNFAGTTLYETTLNSQTSNDADEKRSPMWQFSSQKLAVDEGASSVSVHGGLAERYRRF